MDALWSKKKTTFRQIDGEERRLVEKNLQGPQNGRINVHRMKNNYLDIFAN